MMDAFKQITALRRNSKEFATFWGRYKKHTSDSNVDKYGAAFGGDSRFTNFKVNTFFESHSGVYGNSACGNFGRFDEDFAQKYMVMAMNALREELFAKVAELMQRDAENLVAKARTEVEAMNAALDAVLAAE
mgnify:CR=1 FL=1